MRFLDLFAGIGGFSLGLERAGMTCVGQVELDPFCRRVLEKHWPDVRRIADVRDVRGDEFGEIDLVCGGFPCQDISVAGRRAGIEGTRSGLWSEYSRLVCTLQPRFVLVENVAALLGRGMGRVLGDLVESGYDAEWDCIPAALLGAPHERDRLILVAYPTQSAGRRSLIADAFHDLPRNQQWSSTQSLKSGRGWKRWLNAAAEAVDGQITSADFRGMDDGLPEDMDRIGALGNAVVPQIVEIIGRAILAAEEGINPWAAT